MRRARAALLVLTAVASTLLLACSGAAAASPVSITVSLGFDAPIARVPETFLSVTMDAESLPNHWNYLNFSNPALLSLGRGLAPALLRFGGTAADSTSYDLSPQAEGAQEAAEEAASTVVAPPRALGVEPNVTLTLADFETLNAYLVAAGWQLVFGLNALKRDAADGSWNATEAAQLIALVVANPQRFPVAAFELGNEPQLYNRTFGTWVQGGQMAHDFARLRQMLPEGIKVFGPDPSALDGWLQDFYANITKEGGEKVLQMTTFHHYYMQGIKVKVPDACNPKLLDTLGSYMDLCEAAAKKGGYTGPKAFGETSSFWGGGARGISDRFVAGFTWLDKLGMVASRGWQHVFRQVFVGGDVPPFFLNYGLVSSDGTPNPDYFSSVLHKRLMGREVLSVAQQAQQTHSHATTTKDNAVRFYAHCASNLSSSSLPQKFIQPGAVAVLVLNCHTDQGATVAFANAAGLGDVRLDFILTSSENSGDWQTDMVSKTMNLNGQTLALHADGSLPSLTGASVASSTPLVFPPLSYGFVVFPHAQAKACGYAGAEGLRELPPRDVAEMVGARVAMQ